MKIRNGFISNSSSSNFIVAFPREPKTVEDVKEMVFRDSPVLEDPYYNKNDDYYKKRASSYPADMVAQTIFGDIQLQKPNNHKAIYEAVDDKQEAKEFLSKNTNQFIYVFNYADENGNYFCALEHGDLFCNLQNIVISCH